MEKDFVPYEQALALKELEFDEPCLGLFKEDGSFLYADVFAFRDPYTPSEFKEGVDEGVCYINSEILEESTTAPTYSHAFRWFREKYKLHQIVLADEKGKYDIIVGERISGSCLGQYETYEEAELECLKKLIEIVKTK
jgi:hypothetical protein